MTVYHEIKGDAEPALPTSIAVICNTPYGGVRLCGGRPHHACMRGHDTSESECTLTCALYEFEIVRVICTYACTFMARSPPSKEQRNILTSHGAHATRACIPASANADLLREPLPPCPAAETALCHPSWCSEGLSLHASASPEHVGGADSKILTEEAHLSRRSRVPFGLAT